jgi:predicted nuclease of predicted toxin-antitoxin system
VIPRKGAACGFSSTPICPLVWPNGCGPRGTRPCTCLMSGSPRPDREIFAYAARERQVVVTSDLGVGEILAQSLGGVSVIVVRLRSAALTTVVARLERTLVPIAPALRDGAVVIVEETRPRVRRLPLGRYETCRFCYPGGINPTWRVEHGHLRFGRP